MAQRYNVTGLDFFDAACAAAAYNAQACGRFAYLVQGSVAIKALQFRLFRSLADLKRVSDTAQEFFDSLAVRDCDDGTGDFESWTQLPPVRQPKASVRKKNKRPQKPAVTQLSVWEAQVSREKQLVLRRVVLSWHEQDQCWYPQQTDAPFMPFRSIISQEAQPLQQWAYLFFSDMQLLRGNTHLVENLLQRFRGQLPQPRCLPWEVRLHSDRSDQRAVDGAILAILIMYHHESGSIPIVPVKSGEDPIAPAEYAELMAENGRRVAGWTRRLVVPNTE